MSYQRYKLANFGPAKGGLATVGYTLTGGTRTTAGVAEVGTNTGVYGATVMFADGFSGAILWDTGGGTPAYASEDVNPGPENADVKTSTRGTSTYAGGPVASVTAPVAITSNVKKNQALAAFGFVMTDSTNHAPAPGLTVTATRSLDGGAFAACANDPAAVAGGGYKIDLDATDLSANTVMLRFTATGADDLMVGLVTQP